MAAMCMTLILSLLFVGTALCQTNHCKTATGCTCASLQRATCKRGGMQMIPRFSPILQVLVINGWSRGHNQLDKIYPSDLSGLSRLKEFYASFCELTDVDENAFQRNIGLQKVVLSGNQLIRIRPQTLKPLAILKVLDLTSNLIGSLDPGVFDPLVNLQELKLGQNQLKSVVPDDFKTLRSLVMLDLHGNQLESIGNDTFKFMMKLRILDLSNNNLFSFHGMLPPILRMRGTVHLENNPWRCNCEVRYLQNLSPRIINPGLQNSNLRPMCAGPPKKANLPIAKAGLLDCSPPRIVKCDPLVKVKEGATAVVNCLVEAEPPADVEWATPAGKALETGKLHPRHDVYRNSTFTIDSVTVADNGQYILGAFNKYGSVRYGMRIEVIVPTTTTTTTTTPVPTTTTTPVPTTTTTTPVPTTTTTAVPTTTTTPTPAATTAVPSTSTVKIATTPKAPSVAPTLTPGKTPAPPTLKPPTPSASATPGGVTPKSSTRWPATTVTQPPSQGTVVGGGTVATLAPPTQTASPSSTGNPAGVGNQQGGSGSEEEETGGGPNIGLIAGAAAGGTALLGVIGGVVGFLRLRKRSQAKTAPGDEQPGDKEQKPKKKEEEEEEEDDMELRERPMPPHAIRLVNPRRSAVPSVNV